MSKLGENFGIYGYRQPNRKKKMELLGLDYREPLSENDKETLSAPVEWAAGQMQKCRERWDRWAESDREQALLNSQKEFLVPKDTEERRRRLFVTSPNVVDDALKEYYNGTFKQNIDNARSESDRKAFEAYSRYASIPGAEPFTALGAMSNENDPIDIFESALKRDESGTLDKIAERYAGYAGMNPKEYRHAVLEPALREKVMGEFIKEKTPENSIEYLARGAWRNSLMGGLTDLAVQGYSRKGNNNRYIDDAAMENYNPSRVEQWGAGVAGLLLDAGIFAGIGNGASKITGAATDMVKKRAVAGLLSKGAANGLTRDVAEQMVKKSMVNNLSTKIIQSSMNQGLTLGVYDAAHSVVDDLLHNESVDVTAATGSFAKGVATGGMLGVVGTPLRFMSRGLTGGKKIAASTGVLSAESAVFTASSELQKSASGIDIEPIDLLYDFGESAATLLAMRMFHWRPSGGADKLNSVGRLKKEFRFSASETDEVASAGVNPDVFISNLEKSLNVYRNNDGKAQDRVREDYVKLMSDKNLSAATRAKLLYIVENKLSSTPPLAVDYTVRELGGGKFEFTISDAEGHAIERQFCENKEALNSVYFAKIGNLRRNRIAKGEKLLIQSNDTQNLLKTAGRYAQEMDIDVDLISDVMYRKANKESLSDSEATMMDNIIRRSGLGDSEVGKRLYNLRCQLERNYGLKEGTLLNAIDKSVERCSLSENEALNAYEKAIANEVRTLYRNNSKNATDVLVDSSDNMTEVYNSETEFSKNIRHYKHTPVEIEQIRQEAQELGRRLGCDVKIIHGEGEISVKIPEYANKENSNGWYDDVTNRVVLNLSKNADVSEVKNTIVHEVVGHKGFAELFGNYYYDFLEEVYARGSEEVRKGIEKHAFREGGSYHAGADEYLATLSEQTAATPEQRSIIRRFRDFVRNMLRRLGIYDSEISENELVSLIQRHHSAILNKKSPDSYRSGVFAPFETAWRNDGGYYNDIAARRRFDRYMKRNSEMRDVATGFRDMKRSVYSGADDGNRLPRYRFRYIGEKGLERLKRQKGNTLADKLHFAQLMLDRGFDNDFIREKTGCEHLENGTWRIEISNDVDNVEISDYIYRSLRLYEPIKAGIYREIVNKKPEWRTEKDNEFLKSIYRLELPYDDTARLEDIMYEPLFFSIYPGIEKTLVKFFPLENDYVLYDKYLKLLLVDKRVFAHPDKKNIFLSAVQHIVQEKEGQEFVPMNRKDISDATKKRYEEALAFVTSLNALEKIKGNEETFLEHRQQFMNDYNIDYKRFLECYPNLYEFAEKMDSDYGNGLGVESRLNLTDRLGRIAECLTGPIDIMDIKAMLYGRDIPLLKYTGGRRYLHKDEKRALAGDKWKHYKSYKEGDDIPDYIDEDKARNAKLSDDMESVLLN